MPIVEIADLNLEKLMALGGRLVEHLTGAHATALVYIGDRLGMLKTLASEGPMTSQELADATSLNERYVREWARALVAAGYIEADEAGRFWMTKEQIFQIADEEGPGYLGGAFQLAVGASHNLPRLLDHFRKGGGIPYAEIGSDVTIGVERLWAGCHENFLFGWLGSIPSLTTILSRGAAIADVGCGRGRSSLSLAKLFPASTVVGIDSDHASIEAAEQLARRRGAGDNLSFRTLRAAEMTEVDVYDFIYLFYTLHDFSDPLPALRAMRRALKPNGRLLCVESAASDDPMENRNSPGTMFATVSPLFNLTVAMAESDGGSGTIMTESTVRTLAKKAGFGGFERITISFPPPSVLHRFYLLCP